MKKIYQKTRLIIVTATLLIIGFDARSQATNTLTTFVWSASSGVGDWSNIPNWSYRDPSSLTVLIAATRVPGAGITDEIEIPATVGTNQSVVSITSTTEIFINKLNIFGDNLGQGRLDIGSTSKLSVSLNTTTSNISGTASTSTIALALLGGIINNAGTLKVTSNVAQKGIQFRDATTPGAQQPTLNNTGSLILGSQGTGISFNTSGNTALLTGSGTTSFDPSFMSGQKAFEILSAGTININGGTYNAGNNTTEPIGGLFTISPPATGYPVNLNIASPVIITGFNSASASFDIGGAVPTSGTNAINITNNGQISITGNIGSATSAPGGIRIGSPNSSFLTTTFTNNGTINLSGILRSYGAIGVSAGNNRLVNAGTINISNSGTVNSPGTGASLGIRIAANNSVENINSGTINIVNTDALVTPGISLIGGSLSTFSNSGTITIGGTLTGIIGLTDSKLNNLQAGKIVYNLESTTKTAADGVLIFQNEGTIEGIGQFTAATAAGQPGLNNTVTSVLSPGIGATVGEINIFGSTITLPGTLKIDVASTASRDVIKFNSGTAPTVNFTGNMIINPINTYNPTNGDVVTNTLSAVGTGSNGISVNTATVSSNWVFAGGGTKSINITYNFTLPIKLLSFNGTALQSYTLLKWQTTAEENNKGFDLEKSIDGSKWEKIVFIAGKGQPSNYQYADRNVVKVAYYRLAQSDLDGKVSIYGPIIVSSLISEDISLKIYPNPTQDYINVSLTDIIASSKARLNIYNTAGQKVFSTFYRNESVNISQLKAGKYIMEYNDDDKAFSKVFIKQ